MSFILNFRSFFLYIFWGIGHPFYVATQFHPEYKTRPLSPVPTFLGLILAAMGNLEEHLYVSCHSVIPYCVTRLTRISFKKKLTAHGAQRAYEFGPL